MEPIRILSGRGVPLDRSDVDTDQIIPSEWLKRVERTGFGRGLFSEWRDDTSFVLNQPEFQGARFLVAGPRFGTGSSREHAVWAIQQGGFDAVIAPSFSDIFRNNCTKNGLVPVVLSEPTVNKLWDVVEKDPTAEITIATPGRKRRPRRRVVGARPQTIRPSRPERPACGTASEGASRSPRCPPRPATPRTWCRCWRCQASTSRSLSHPRWPRP